MIWNLMDTIEWLCSESFLVLDPGGHYGREAPIFFPVTVYSVASSSWNLTCVFSPLPSKNGLFQDTILLLFPPGILNFQSLFMGQ